MPEGEMMLSKMTAFFVAIMLLSGGLALAEKVQTEGAEAGVWTMDMDAAKKLAKKKKLPLVLNFTGSDWCGWCKLMEKNVFTKESWRKYAKKKHSTSF